jgi:flagellar protein FliO/FliZ
MQRLLKMVLGLAVVLAVMALITWALKRFMPNIGSNNQSAIRVVGGVSVGSRERVVVLEVAGRWLVVGVAAGQVNGIANLDAGAIPLAGTGQLASNAQLAETVTKASLEGFTQSMVPSFAQWLKKSAAKFTETNHAEKLNEK